MANFRWLMAVTTRVHSPMVKSMARECGSFHRLVVNTPDSLSKGSYMGGAPWSTQHLTYPKFTSINNLNNFFSNNGIYLLNNGYQTCPQPHIQKIHPYAFWLKLMFSRLRNKYSKVNTI